ESDFVFAGLAEDLGFVGAVILFALYAVLLVATLRIAFRARDPFGTFLAAGVFSMLSFQLIVNVGMAMSLMPVTGIPLPFISHGSRERERERATAGVTPRYHRARAETRGCGAVVAHHTGSVGVRGSNPLSSTAHGDGSQLRWYRGSGPSVLFGRGAV